MLEAIAPATAPAPLDILRTVFGYDRFRGLQQQVVEHVLAGGDALVLMPTGGGKSLCFQIPALCREGVAIVVSPLIALMQDQVAALRLLGVRAAALNMTVPYDEARAIERRMQDGTVDLVYAAPERLLQPGFLELLDGCRIALFAIDEAHCVSQWGHDFRPDYRQLTVLHERFPGVPRIALTATADERTRQDIAERLCLQQGRLFVAGFDRPNIRYTVVPRKRGPDQLLRFIRERHAGAAGIVYCMARRTVDETAGWLTAEGLTALPYHAGLEGRERAANQDRFLKEDGVIMVATIAFGMGIDKPDVRFVAHLDLPKSLEAYYQETGRAGRDGLPADAWLAYGLEDVQRLRRFVDDSETDPRHKRLEHEKLEALLAFLETARCRRQVLLAYFGEALAAPCGNCDTCLEPVDTFDGSVPAQKVLSCAYRTGQRFGAGHLIDVLTGARTEKILRLGHDRLSVYGIGTELDKNGWRSVIRQLLALGLVKPDADGHGGLVLGAGCREVLRGERPVELRRDPRRRGGGSGRSGARPGTMLDKPEDEVRFQALRGCRRALAEAQGVPPYLILHDSTLAEIARRRPDSLDELGRIPGIGQAKLERYGAAILAALG